MPTTSYWECPKCHKEFAKTNQSHKCEIVDVKDLFRRHDPSLYALYKHLLAAIKGIGKWKITTSSKAITLYTAGRKAFLGISVHRKYLDLWFFLENKTEEFPVYKVVQPTKKKYGHFVRIYSKDDIDDLLIAWLAESYTLMNE
jgi:hypothetical protein